MQRRQLWSLIVVVVVAVFALIIALPIDHPSWFDSIQFWNPEGTRSVELKQGLDLKGGLQVLLEFERRCHKRQHGRRQKGGRKPCQWSWRE